MKLDLRLIKESFFRHNILNILGSKQAWVKTFWVKTPLGQNSIGSKLLWVKTSLGQNSFGPIRLWVKRIGSERFGPKHFGSKFRLPHTIRRKRLFMCHSLFCEWNTFKKCACKLLIPVHFLKGRRKK